MTRISNSFFGELKIDTDSLHSYSQQLSQAENYLTQAQLLLTKIIFAFQIQLSGPQAHQALVITNLCQSIINELYQKKLQCQDLAHRLLNSAELYGKCEKDITGFINRITWIFNRGELRIGSNASEKIAALLNATSVIFPLGLLKGALETGIILFSAQILHVRKSKTSQLNEPFTQVSDLLAALEKVDTDKNLGHLQVVKHEQNGRTAWTVLIPGTQNWSLFTTNPQNLSTNIHTNNNLPNVMERAVDQSLSQAGYRSGDPLELVGHSQGGAVAVGFARRYRHKYNVRSVLTAGSNLGQIRLPEQIKLLAVENSNDIVPGLDGRQNRKAKNINTIKIHDPAQDCQPNLKQHNLEEYRRLSSEQDFNSRKEITNWNRYRQQELGINFTQKTRSTSYNFDLTSTRLPQRSTYPSPELSP